MRFFKFGGIIALALVLSLAAAVGGTAVAEAESLEVSSRLAERYDCFGSLAFFYQTFGVGSDVMLYVESAEDKNLFETINSFASYEGVRQLIWYGSFLEFAGLGLEIKGADYLREDIGEGMFRYFVICLLESSPFGNGYAEISAKMIAALDGKKVVTAGLTHASREIIKKPFSRADLSGVSNQIAVAVPAKTLSGTHKQYIEELYEAGVEGVAGFFSAEIDERAITYLLTNTAVAEGIGLEGLIGEYEGELWTLYALRVAPEYENRVRQITEKYFGKARYLSYAILRRDASRVVRRASGWAIFLVSALTAAAVLYFSAAKFHPNFIRTIEKGY